MFNEIKMKTVRHDGFDCRDCANSGAPETSSQRKRLAIALQVSGGEHERWKARSEGRMGAVARNALDQSKIFRLKEIGIKREHRRLRRSVPFGKIEVCLAERDCQNKATQYGMQ